MDASYKGIISVVEKLAPAVAGAIGGPIGSLVVSSIESLFGLTNSTPDQLAQAIQADPDQSTGGAGLDGRRHRARKWRASCSYTRGGCFIGWDGARRAFDSSARLSNARVISDRVSNTSRKEIR